MFGVTTDADKFRQAGVNAAASLNDPNASGASALLQKGMRDAVLGSYAAAGSRGANPLATRAAVYGGADVGLRAATNAALLRSQEMQEAARLQSAANMQAAQMAYQQQNADWEKGMGIADRVAGMAAGGLSGGMLSDEKTKNIAYAEGRKDERNAQRKPPDVNQKFLSPQGPEHGRPVVYQAGDWLSRNVVQPLGDLAVGGHSYSGSSAQREMGVSPLQKGIAEIGQGSTRTPPITKSSTMRLPTHIGEPITRQPDVTFGDQEIVSDEHSKNVMESIAGLLSSDLAHRDPYRAIGMAARAAKRNSSGAAQPGEQAVDIVNPWPMAQKTYADQPMRQELAASTPLFEYEYNDKAQKELGMPPGKRVGTGARAVESGGPLGEEIVGEAPGGVKTIKADEGVGAALGMSAAAQRQAEETRKRVDEISAKLNAEGERTKSQLTAGSTPMTAAEKAEYNAASRSGDYSKLSTRVRAMIERDKADELSAQSQESAYQRSRRVLLGPEEGQQEIVSDERMKEKYDQLQQHAANLQLELQQRRGAMEPVGVKRMFAPEETPAPRYQFLDIQPKEPVENMPQTEIPQRLWDPNAPTDTQARMEVEPRERPGVQRFNPGWAQGTPRPAPGSPNVPLPTPGTSVVSKVPTSEVPEWYRKKYGKGGREL